MGLNDSIAKAINWKTPVVDSRDSMKTVVDLMNQENVSALTVRDDQENIVGIVTDIDVMDCIVKRMDLNRVKTLDIMSSCRLISDESTKTPCAQLDVNETIFNAFSVMSSGGFHHLMVSDSNNKVGMISISELFKHILD